MDDLYLSDLDLSISREKQKARILRKSAWWHRKSAHAVCYYCQIKLQNGQATMDHVIPLSRGGKSDKGNLVPACKECNTLKKNMNSVEWVLYIAAKGGTASATTQKSPQTTETVE